MTFVPAVPSFVASQVNHLSRGILFEVGSVAALIWTPSDVFSVEVQDAYNIDIALFGLLRQGNTASWTEIAQLAVNVSNSGQANVTVPTILLHQNHSAYLPIAFQVRFSPLSVTDRNYDLLSVPAGIWTGESIYSYAGTPSRDRCIAWASHLQARETEWRQIDNLAPCPCNLEQAKAPNSGFKEVQLEYPFREFFNPQAAVCYYQSNPMKT